MKIYQKKSAAFEDETVLVQLERRHTSKEATNEADLEDNLRKTTRANSLGIFEESRSSTDIEAVDTEKKISFTRRPTVITESELSSSWLYKDRKAKINSDDESVEDTISTMPSENHEDLEPRTQRDSNLKPLSVSNQSSRKMSSCCWYFTIVLVTCIACLAVMAGVGGIVYMEFFATFKDKSNFTDMSLKQNKHPSDSKEIFQHLPREEDNSHRNEPIIPVHILKDVIKNFTILEKDTDVSRRATDFTSAVTSKSKENMLHNKDLTDSNNSKAKELNNTKNSFVYENQDVEMNERPKIPEHSVIFPSTHGRISHFNIPISDKSVEIKNNAKNQDSLELKLDYQSIDDMDEMPDGHVVNVSINDEKSQAEVSDSSEKTLASGRNFNFGEMTTLQGFELIVEKVNEELQFQNLPKENSIEHSVHLLPNGNFLDNVENSIDNKHGDNFFDHRQHSIAHDPKDNSLGRTEHSIDNSHENNFFGPTEHFIHHNDKSLNDYNEDSSDFYSDDNPSEKHSLAEDKNQNFDDSDQLVLIRPVVESKAVPVPLAFLRRIGFDIKNPNSHQPMTAKDMDIKFSLAEALKFLRSLDADNKLPTLREKNITRERSNHEESNKTKLTIISA